MAALTRGRAPAPLACSAQCATRRPDGPPRLRSQMPRRRHMRLSLTSACAGRSSRRRHCWPGCAERRCGLSAVGRHSCQCPASAAAWTLPSLTHPCAPFYLCGAADHQVRAGPRGVPEALRVLGGPRGGGAARPRPRHVRAAAAPQGVCVGRARSASGAARGPSIALAGAPQSALERRVRKILGPDWCGRLAAAAAPGAPPLFGPHAGLSCAPPVLWEGDIVDAATAMQ